MVVNRIARESGFSIVSSYPRVSASFCPNWWMLLWDGMCERFIRFREYPTNTYAFGSMNRGDALWSSLAYFAMYFSSIFHPCIRV